MCTFVPLLRGSSSVGRASASQAEGREFEPRLPLNQQIAGNKQIKLLFSAICSYNPGRISVISSLDFARI